MYERDKDDLLVLGHSIGYYDNDLWIIIPEKFPVGKFVS